MVGRWDRFTKGASAVTRDGLPSLSVALEHTIREVKLPRRRIVVVRQAPSQDGIVPRVLVSAVRRGEDARSIGKIVARHEDERRVEAQVFAALEAMGVQTIDPASVLCDVEMCRAAVGSYAAYYDDNHLSKRGAMRLVPLIEDAIADSLGEMQSD
jgi:hypothetical protein